MYQTIADLLEGFGLPEQTHKIVMAVLLLAEYSPRLYIFGDTIQILVYGQMGDETKADVLSLGFRLSVSGNVIIDL